MIINLNIYLYFVEYQGFGAYNYVKLDRIVGGDGRVKGILHVVDNVEYCGQVWVVPSTVSFEPFLLKDAITVLGIKGMDTGQRHGCRLHYIRLRLSKTYSKHSILLPGGYPHQSEM